MTAPWRLYLDDERPCPEGYTLARSTAEALALVDQRGLPADMSLDHDLGGDDTAMAFVRALEARFEEPPYRWNVHSANPVGARNLESFLTSWRRVLEAETPYVFDGRVGPGDVGPGYFSPEQVRRVVFLDLDGVLNTDLDDTSLVVRPFPWEVRARVRIDLAANLGGLLAATGASVVFCTSWRRHFRYSLPKMLARHFGINAPVLGMTRCTDYDGRAQRPDARSREIDTWLREAAACGSPVGRWVWIDDEPAPASHTDHQTLCSPLEGLTLDRAEAAARMLED